MGHYSDVYFGYSENVANKVESLFRKKLRNVVASYGTASEPIDLFQDYFVGKYRDYGSDNADYDAWMVCTSKSVKWYDSYVIPGAITAIVKYMEKNPITFPQIDWFWIEVGEQFPADRNDFTYYGDINYSPMDMSLSINEKKGDGYDIEHIDDARLYPEPLPPYSFGTINHAYIDDWVDYMNKEDRIMPDDEIWG